MEVDQVVVSYLVAQTDLVERSSCSVAAQLDAHRPVAHQTLTDQTGAEMGSGPTHQLSK